MLLLQHQHPKWVMANRQSKQYIKNRAPLWHQNYQICDCIVQKKEHHYDTRSTKFGTKQCTTMKPGEPNLWLYWSENRAPLWHQKDEFGTKLNQIWYCSVPKTKHNYDTRTTKIGTVCTKNKHHSDSVCSEALRTKYMSNIKWATACMHETICHERGCASFFAT